jgi:hypothetical protein
VGTGLENGQALRDALASLDTSGGKTYLLKIEPGVYDVGSTPLGMRQGVDLAGSGPEVTAIRRTGTSATILAAASGPPVAIRDLEVRSSGSIAVLAQANVRLENDFIFASGPDTAIFGVRAENGATPKVVDSQVSVQPTGANFGAAIDTEPGAGVEIYHSDVIASAIVAGGFGAALSINGDGKVLGSRLIGAGTGGAGGFAAIDNGSSSTLTIDSSYVAGSERAVGAAATDKILIGASKVIGGHDPAAAGTHTCIFSYKADYTATNSTCD